VSRPHGRVKYVVEKCRCDVCRAESTAWNRAWRRRRAYGIDAYVDAEPARQHVRGLMAGGLGAKRIAALSGVPHGGVSKLLYGDPQRGMAPSKRIRQATETRLLAVEATLDTLGARALLDGTGTRRRLRALVARGWSKRKLSLRLGMQPSNFGATFDNDKVRASTARAVRVLYDELWNVTPPEATHGDRIAASRARRYAQTQGYAPPLAWDDDTIDDPDAKPEGAVPAPLQGLPPLDELLWLIDCGESSLSIATRFGVRPATVYRALLRHREAA
jgi:hypothetical protein